MPGIKNVLWIACFISVISYVIDMVLVSDFNTSTSLPYTTTRATATFQFRDTDFIIHIWITIIIYVH
jgi:hypothetical protein